MSNFLNIQAKLKVLLSQRIENHVFFYYFLAIPQIKEIPT